MSTTTAIIIAVVVVIGVLGTILVARSRRRGAQASERMGLPPVGTLSGEPLNEAPSTTTSVKSATPRTGGSRV
jgi:hypothetical protein